MEKNELVDIRDVKVDVNLTLEEKIDTFLSQIGDHNTFRHGKLTIRLKYSDTNATIEDRMKGYFLTF